jgi:hypothetical protein
MGLLNVLAKIEGLNIFIKTQRQLEVNKPKLLLPIVTKVQGHRSPALTAKQRYFCP